MAQKDDKEKVVPENTEPLNRIELENFYGKPFASLFIADYINDKLMNRVFDRLYTKEFAKRLKPYSILACTGALNDIVKLQEAKGDLGEKMITTDTAVKKGEANHEWQCSTEPVTQNSVNCFLDASYN